MENEFVLTAYDYLIDKVKFDVPKKTMLSIMVVRGIDLEALYEEVDKDTLRLAYADTLKWFIIGPSKKNNVSDSDNGWSHSEGGYQISDEDRKEMKAEANAIYKELEPESVMKRKSTFRMVSHGIKRANVTSYGMKLPHTIK